MIAYTPRLGESRAVKETHPASVLRRVLLESLAENLEMEWLLYTL